MITSLTRITAALAVAGTAALAAPAAGAAQQPPAPAPAPITDLDQEELETFAEAYIEVNEIARQAEASLATVQDPEEAQLIQAQAQQSMEGVLDAHDLDPERYRNIGMTLNENEELRQRFIAVIQEMQEGGGLF